jgi:hypothetical protein
MDDGEEQIEDEGLVQQIQKQAKKVQKESIIFTGILEVLILLIP